MVVSELVTREIDVEAMREAHRCSRTSHSSITSRSGREIERRRRFSMRNVLLFMHMSLDGFVSGPKGEFDWAVGSEKEMNDELLYELVRTNDTVLLGRVAYHE